MWPSSYVWLRGAEWLGESLSVLSTRQLISLGVKLPTQKSVGDRVPHTPNSNPSVSIGSAPASIAAAPSTSAPNSAFHPSAESSVVVSSKRDTAVGSNKRKRKAGGDLEASDGGVMTRSQFHVQMAIEGATVGLTDDRLQRALSSNEYFVRSKFTAGKFRIELALLDAGSPHLTLAHRRCMCVTAAAGFELLPDDFLLTQKSESPTNVEARNQLCARLSAQYKKLGVAMETGTPLRPAARASRRITCTLCCRGDGAGTCD